jgi:hypothetical protein
VKCSPAWTLTGQFVHHESFTVKDRAVKLREDPSILLPPVFRVNLRFANRDPEVDHSLL